MSQPVPRPAPRDLGKDSLLWRYAGDHRLGLTGLSAGLLQLMHPGIGAGVAQHSSFFEDPWDRIVRSVPQILGVVYGPDPEAIGHRVRDYHRSIRGMDHMGRRYSALNPATFWWAHATFQHSVEQVVDRFDTRRLTPREREQLYRDGVEWYRRYGVTMKPVPRSYTEFRAEWKRVCNEELEMTPAADRAVDMALRDRSLAPPFLPWWTKPLQPFVVTPLLQLTSIGGLPSAVRKRFGIPWRIDQQVEYRTLQIAVREWWRWLPDALRYGPVASQARKRVATLAEEAGAA